jgi:flagellin FlaB
MEQKRKSLLKDEKAFTGLEAAIVLTAFIVVAAVFSYMVLGAGFFSTEKAKEVVHTGVEQATSSMQFSGDIIAKEGSTADTIGYIIATTTLTAGESSIDIGSGSAASNLTISYSDSLIYTPDATWSRTWIETRDSNDMLDYGEKVELNITVPASSLLAANATATDAEIAINIKPVAGAILPINKRTPSAIDSVMVLN